MTAGHSPGGPDIPGVPGTQVTPGMPRTQETDEAREDPWAPLWDRARTGIAAIGHGVVFFPLMLAGLGLLLLILALTLSGPGLAAYGFGQHHSNAGTARALALPALGVSVLLICSLLLVMRRLASLTGGWSASGAACPSPIPICRGPGRRREGQACAGGSSGC